MKEMWKKIPGYENYSIDENTMNVRNDITGNYLTTNKGVVNLSKNGVCRSYTTKRLLYCAIHGYLINKIPSDIVISKNGDSLKIYTRSEYSRMVVKRSNRTKITIKEGYEDLMKLANIVLSCKRNNNYEELIKILYGYKEKTKSFLVRNRYISNINEADELVSIAIDNAVERIIDGEVIAFPMKYITRLAIRIKKDINENKRKERAIYDERRIV